MRLSEITKKTAETAEFRGTVYRLRPAFRRVLAAAELMADGRIRYAPKCRYALKILLSPLSYITALRLSENGRAELLDRVFDALTDGGKKQSRKIISFEKDGGRIYAAFLQSYGIDLAREGEKISWRQFIQLLGNLPENTRLCEIMKIRSEEIPTDNPRYAAELARLKAIYDINDNSYGAGIERLFGSLFRAAENKERNDKNG